MSPSIPPEPRLTFDQAVAQALQDTAMAVLARHPEVRGVAIAIDYHGELNRAGIAFGSLVCGSGGPSRLDELFGLAEQISRLQRVVAERCVEVVGVLKQQAAVLGTEGENCATEANQASAGGEPGSDRPDIGGPVG